MSVDAHVENDVKVEVDLTGRTSTLLPQHSQLRSEWRIVARSTAEATGVKGGEQP